jgi:hypothetical protein
MLERYADGQERVLTWLHEGEAAAARSRDAIHLVAWVLLLGGLGVLVALRFTVKDEALFGWLPIGVALGLFVHMGFSCSKPTDH